MARYDDLNTSALGYLTFMSVIFLIITVLLLQAMTYNWIESQEEAKLVKQSYVSSDEAIQAQKDALTKYQTVKVEVSLPVEGQPDKTELKTVERRQIPIDRAEAILLDEFKKKANKEATPGT